MSAFRRPQRPKAKRPILHDGGVIKPGETLPRSIPTRDIDMLGSHGYAERRKGDQGVGS